MDRGHISSPSFFSLLFVFGDLKIVTQELWCLCKASSDFWASKNLFRVVFCVLKTAEGSHRNRFLKVTATNLIFRLQLNMTRAALLPHQKGGEKPEQQHKSLQGNHWPSCRSTHLRHQYTGPMPSTTHKTKPADNKQNQ